MTRTIIKTAVIAIAAILLLQLAGGLLFMASGLYNIAADQPHIKPVGWLLRAGRTRAVRLRSQGLRPPNLRDPALLKRGFLLHRENCQPCHGAPGVANEQIGRGIDPKPPQLVIASNKWNDSELFWIASHGLKLSGMPGFAPRLSETDLWAIVAFVRRMVLLSPAEYKSLSAAQDRGLDYPSLSWPPDNDYGFRQLKAHGDPEMGRQLIQTYGCGSCHTLPGLTEAAVGPPLTYLAEHPYIAGSLVNVPANAVAWIANPKQFKPQTAMPNLNVPPSDALHITAYLYTSGSPERITALERALGIPKASSIRK